MSKQKNAKLFKKNERTQRVNYEDPSTRFLSWVDSLDSEKSFIGRSVQNLQNRPYLQQFILVFLFCILLSYLIFFRFESSYSFKAGDVALFDVHSPFEFEMTDVITTEEKRNKAEQSVTVIYDYDPAVFERVSTGVIFSFRNMRSHLRDVVWSKTSQGRLEKMKELFQFKPQFEKDLGVNISDFTYEWLVEQKFNPRIEAILIRNLGTWYERKIAERFISTQQEQVLVRVVHRNSLGREYFIKKNEILDLQTPENFVFEDRRGLVVLNESDRANLLYFARSILVPNLTLNKQETTIRRQAARDSVAPVNIVIKKNQNIIQKGSMIQANHVAILKKIEDIRLDRSNIFVIFSMATILLLTSVVFFSYVRRFTVNRIQVGFKDLFVMMLIALGSLATNKIFYFITDNAFVSRLSGLIPASAYLFMAPLALGPMLVGLLVTSGEVVWLFTAFMAICLGVMGEFNFPLMLAGLLGGIAAARGVHSCKTRNQIYWAGIRTGLVNAFIIILYVVITRADYVNIGRDLFFNGLGAFIGGIFSSLAAMMVLPLLESLFNYTTDVKLLELSNLNHPLLKNMLIKSPGTYHHSMMVGSMVEAAAEEIGANPLLGKVMSYYHDIGKMEHAKYFIENQKPGQNPHDLISPYMSKTLLIAHVKDGVELGMAYKLGKPIIDGILQHHGTTLISYFYNKALEMNSDEEVSEEDFRYPGPKPQFREAALCMLADSIEAAARSLDEPTPSRLQNIVKNVIQKKFADGQLDECNLTLKDLSKVETAFIRILLGIYHQRIDYPRSAGGQLSETQSINLGIVR